MASRYPSDIMGSELEVTNSSGSVPTDLTVSDVPSTVNTITTGDNTTIRSSHSSNKLLTQAVAGSSRTGGSKTGSSIPSMKCSSSSTTPAQRKVMRHREVKRPEVKFPSLESTVPKIDVSLLFNEIEKLKMQNFKLIDSNTDLESRMRKLQKQSKTGRACKSDESSTSSGNNGKPIDQLQAYLVKLTGNGVDQGRSLRTSSPSFSVNHGNESINSDTNLDKILELVKKLSDDRAQLEEKRETDLCRYQQLNARYYQLELEINKCQMAGKGQTAELNSLLKIQSLENDRLKLQLRSMEAKVERLEVDKGTLETKLQLSTSMVETSQREAHKERSELTLQIQDLTSKLRMFESAEANMNDFVAEAAAAADESNEGDIIKILNTQYASVPTTRKGQIMHSFELSKKILALEKGNNELRDELARLRDDREALRRQVYTLQAAIELGKNQSVTDILTAFITQCNKTDKLNKEILALQRDKEAQSLAHSVLLHDLKELKKQSAVFKVVKQSKCIRSSSAVESTNQVKISGPKSTEIYFPMSKPKEEITHQLKPCRKISMEDTAKSASGILLQSTSSAKSAPRVRLEVPRTNSSSLILCDATNTPTPTCESISRGVLENKSKTKSVSKSKSQEKSQQGMERRFVCYHKRSKSAVGKRFVAKDPARYEVQGELPGGVSKSSTSYFDNAEHKVYKLPGNVKMRRSNTTITGRSGISSGKTATTAIGKSVSAGKSGSTKRNGEGRVGQGDKERRREQPKTSTSTASNLPKEIADLSSDTGSCCSVYHSESYLEISTEMCCEILSRPREERTIGSSCEDLDYDEMPLEPPVTTEDQFNQNQMARGDRAKTEENKRNALSLSKVKKPKSFKH